VADTSRGSGPAGDRADAVASRGALVGLAVTALLLVATFMTEPLFPIDVHTYFPPLHAHGMPRWGPGTLPAIGAAAVLVGFGPRLARSLSWRWLLLLAWLAGVVWMLSLALVDGVGGVADPLEDPYEYLPAARALDDVPQALDEYVSRIPYAAPRRWPAHVAGHPPGALLFFVALVRLGVDTGLGVGIMLVLLGATTPLAVATTLRVLGAEPAARVALPFMVLGPAAIWVAVSADGGVFAPTAAWGLAALAVAARRRSLAWSLLAGVLLGWCVFLSYGFVLLGLLAVGVLLAARTAYPLLGALVGALTVTAAFLTLGFSWFEAYPVLRERYYDGIARQRQYSYWVFGNLAAFALSAGPMVWAGVGGFAARGPRRLLRAAGAVRVVAILGAAAVLSVLAADMSGMSKGEVERIWLPFTPWALLLVVLLPPRWRHAGLVLQAATALVVQHLFFSKW
jgi:hypothetical protein